MEGLISFAESLRFESPELILIIIPLLYYWYGSIS